MIGLGATTTIGLNQTNVSAAKTTASQTVKKSMPKKQVKPTKVKITSEKQAVKYLAHTLKKAGADDRNQLAYVPVNHTKKYFKVRIVDRDMQKSGGSGTVDIAKITHNGKIIY